jgi:DNA replicative helicase MCM subunit Mcm2 (Cdc46/Mcm family)
MIIDREIRKIITSICYEKGQAMIEEIYDQANKKGITPNAVDDIVGKLRQGGILFSPSNDVYSFA